MEEVKEIILTEQELQSLALRSNLIFQAQANLQILSREKEFYQKELYEKYKLDINKKYSIDNRGVVTEGKNADDKGTNNNKS